MNMSKADDVLGFREDHESYGMLGFYRQTSSGSHPLFGSSIKHRDTICMRLKRGHKRRNLNQDWYYGDNTIVEVVMSATQFADIITQMNMGDGHPVTITYLEGNRMEEPPYESHIELHQQEFDEHLQDVYEDTQNLIKEVSEKFSSKKSFNKKDQEEILRTLHRISMNIGCNQSFQSSQFNEQMEKIISESKGEIEAFFQNKMYQIAQQAMVDDPEKFIEGVKSPVEVLEEIPKKKLKRVDKPADSEV